LKSEEQETMLYCLIENFLGLNHKNNTQIIQILADLSPKLMIKALSDFQQKIPSDILIPNLETLMRRVPEEERMDFLSRLGITNIKDLSSFLNLLNQLPENDRYHLVMEIDLSQFDNVKLCKIMAVLPEKDQQSFIKYLKEKYVKEIVISTSLLPAFLRCFSDKEQVTLISLMGEKFYQMLASSDLNQHKKIFKLLKPSLRLDIFKKMIERNENFEMTNEDFFEFIKIFEPGQMLEALRAIPNLSKFITSDIQLFYLLNMLPEKDREELLFKIDLNLFFSKSLFPNYLMMLSFIAPERRKEYFIATNGKNILQMICQHYNADYLVRSYNYCNVKPDEIFDLLGNEFFKNMILNGQDLSQFLSLTNFKNDSEKLVATFGLNVLGFLIKPYQEVKSRWNGHDGVSTKYYIPHYPWELISEKARYLIFEKLCTADPNYAAQNQSSILRALPCDTWEVFSEEVLGKELEWQEIFPDYNALNNQLINFPEDQRRIILSKCYTVLSNLEIGQILDILEKYLPASRLAFILDNDAKPLNDNKILPKMLNTDTLVRILGTDFMDQVEAKRFIQLLIQSDGSDNKSKSALLLESYLECVGHRSTTTNDMISNYLLDYKLKRDFKAICDTFKNWKGCSIWKNIVSECQLTQENKEILSSALNNTEARVNLLDKHLDTHFNVAELKTKSSLNNKDVVRLLQELNTIYSDVQDGSIFKPQSQKHYFFAVPRDLQQYTKLIGKLEKQAWEILNLGLQGNLDHKASSRELNKNLLDAVASMPILAKWHKQIESNQANYGKQTSVGR
jgi:hypothetical protein